MQQPVKSDNVLRDTDDFGVPVQAQAADADSTRVLPALGESLPHTTLASDAERQDGVGALRQVGRYQIGERIGRGAMATVYKGYDPDIGRPLALKFLHADLCVNAEYRSRFLREAKAAGGLAHPNIVTVFDTGEIQGRPYIAMELIEGAPLSEIMRPGEPLPVRDVCDIGVQLARALDYAHRKGIYHRDIKPSNILRVKDSNTIKVTDFGIAHMHDVEQTRIGSVLGTPQYMSPEQAKGQKVDGRSDLFSAGVVLYQLLTGQAPFQADSIFTLGKRIAEEEPTPIDKLRRDVPAALRRVVERCLRKTPDKRYATGEELAEALSKVIAEFDEDRRSGERERLIPLRIKLTAIMALVVAVTMAVTAAVVSQRQYAAMMSQVIEYGASLAKFLAAENSTYTLAREWEDVQVSIEDIMKSQDFHEITLVDNGGIVRASSNGGIKRQPYRLPPGAQTLDTRADGVVVRSYKTDTGFTIIDFDAPVMYGNGARRVEKGRMHLGIAEQPLSRVARSSLVWMGVLTLVTIAAVMLATYLLARRYSKPLRLLAESMREIEKGRYDYRIAEQRSDEFGQAYRAFDDMAQTLQQRVEPRSPRTEE